MNNGTYLPPSEQRLLIRFWRSARGYWGGTTAWWAWLLTGLLVTTVILQLLTQYWLNYWNRDFFNAVERKDGAELLTQAWRFAPIATASLALAVFSVWGRMTLQREWRKWLSRHLYAYWLGNDRYTRLRFIKGEHQAPEYRIAEDARAATDLPVDLTIGLLSSLLTAITFIGVLWRVGGSLTIEMDGLSLNIPGYLVVAVLVYSFIVAVAAMLVGRRLTHVMEDNKRTEAELRAIGTHIRESGEGKTLPDDRGDRLPTVSAALHAVIAAWLVYCWQLMRLTLVTQTNSLLTPVVGLLLCMPKYVAGTMLLGEVVQAAAAFVVVQGACNWFTDSYARLAEWVASANRVASLLLALDQIDPSKTDAG
jgi:putative ATP-binding cassette transporter